jgi:hypothetical protein
MCNPDNEFRGRPLEKRVISVVARRYGLGPSRVRDLFKKHRAEVESIAEKDAAWDEEIRSLD